ncbi:hypothetical protein BWI97_23835 [Siphonobacter sp. BAB-5405]|uniref:T9SS type A sorting domain-containing protein n=1 Tax=Siphonobacter sp. BAB-5405 TaxID=1864825 RepID=UPI000C803495|nr:T9SS type A sorting domain-containing protein [Siphonobacter sp. BAB-5405]PMD90505.1 hypothetical protein BWI97_23835 [Siphonobacter sp. BAB-5405]
MSASTSGTFATLCRRRKRVFGAGYLANGFRKNTSHFEVQRNQDGEHWNVLGTQKARGESQSLINYRFVDEYPLRGINYYRLKMMDKDDTFTYTRAQSVEMARGTAIVYPNPVAETLYLKNVEATLVREVVLQDLRGVVFFRSSDCPARGINVRKVTKGTYLLTVIEHSGFARSYKVIIGH